MNSNHDYTTFALVCDFIRAGRPYDTALQLDLKNYTFLCANLSNLGRQEHKASALCPISYGHRFFRVGCMVLLCHDLRDVLMEAAKMCKYCGAEAASTALFVAFMLTWAAARLVYFPCWLIRSTLCACVTPPSLALLEATACACSLWTIFIRIHSALSVITPERCM